MKGHFSMKESHFELRMHTVNITYFKDFGLIFTVEILVGITGKKFV